MLIFTVNTCVHIGPCKLLANIYQYSLQMLLVYYFEQFTYFPAVITFKCLYCLQGVHEMFTNVTCRYCWYFALKNWHIFLQLLHVKYLYFFTGHSCNGYKYYLQMLQVFCLEHLAYFPAVITCKKPVFLTGYSCDYCRKICQFFWQLTFKIYRDYLLQACSGKITSNSGREVIHPLIAGNVQGPM